MNVYKVWIEVVHRARFAMLKVQEYLHCTHPEPHKVLNEDTWWEDEEVMSRRVQCTVCERTLRLAGHLKYDADGEWEW